MIIQLWIYFGEVNTVRKLYGRKGKRANKITSKKRFERRHILMICLVAFGAFSITIGTLQLLSIFRESREAQDQYEVLREIFMFVEEDIPTIAIISEEPEADPGTDPFSLPEENEIEIGILRRPSMEELYALNSDFVGWMSIQDVIEYPIVRGQNNTRYLSTTFMGSRNPAGTIFMDYRNINGFDEKIKILYGHNMRDGTMFSSITRYLDSNFMQENPSIIITTLDGRTLEYRVFAALLTDAWDMAYTVSIHDPRNAPELFPNVPSGASSFLLLSTCTLNNNDDERILVYAALVD